MAERSDGVFFSRVEADDWEHDEETGGLVHLLRADDAAQAGLWKPGETAGRTIELELVAHETVLVLAGTGTLQVDGGPVIELAAGDMISMPKGARTTWVVDADFKEFWVYSDPDG
jgi:uncharacterized cupin superfamily protein